MALLVVGKTVFSILVLHHVAAMINAQDDQSGFISIECGSPQGTNHTQQGIHYISDEYGFIEGGERHSTSSAYRDGSFRVYNTLRSFPQNERTCYTLRPQKGKNNRYLIKAIFYHGNYDSRDHPPQFDLYIGADFWATIHNLDPRTLFINEMIHLPSSDYIYVCLVNTGNGNPFITALELRLLDITMYEERTSLILKERFSFGTDEIIRYKDDKYDRTWNPIISDGCTAFQALDTVFFKSFGEEQVPLKVARTAITPTYPAEIIGFTWNTSITTNEFVIYIHLAEVEILKINQKREFNIINNGIQIGIFSPTTNITTIRNEFDSSRYSLKLNRTSSSTLPPILNALEIYALKQLLQNQTDDQDAAAIWSTKSTYGLMKLNWQGDPCVPQAWVGLNCKYSAPRTAKIISLNLSSKGLSGEIATALANLTMIESLDLSYNNLTGNVPDFLARLDSLRILNLTGNNFTQPLPAELLAKSRKGLLWLRTEEGSSVDESSCLDGSCRKNKHIVVVILAPIIGCIVVLPIIVFMVKRLRDKALINREKGFTQRKQQFTHSELVVVTNNFQNKIGKGGFGSVFHGSIGDNQVAVKMLSESSSQGYKEFETEVKFLMKLHHKNITSLVGYCDDSNHKGIIYDFMENGNLEKHLFDGCPNVLSWEIRLQIGCDVAEGLAYMHHGCRPPIVHRDVKSSNILLNGDFQAKLADFGLSRAFPTEDASHVTASNIAGTLGYTDPEYRSTEKLREKSDVYSDVRGIY